MKIIILMLSLLVAGCGTSLSLREQQIKVVVNSCPAIVNYTPEEQRIAAKELQALFTNSQLVTMINDYAKLREACRIVNRKIKAYRAVKKKKAQ